MENSLSNSFPVETDVFLKGVNLTGLLVALASANSGLNVVISIDKQIDYTYQPELVAIYPLRVTDFFTFRYSLTLLEKVGSFYPTLVYPQRILTLWEGRKLDYRILSITDKLLKRERDEASLPLSFAKYSQYKSFEENFENAALIPEFRFDRNMLLIYLLHECKKQGIRIISNNEAITTRVRIICNKPDTEKNKLTVEAENYPFKNNIRIINSLFETHVQKLDEKLLISFFFHKHIDSGLFVEKTTGYLKALGIKKPDDYSIALKQICSKHNNNKQVIDNNDLVIDDPEFGSLKHNYKKALERIFKKTGVKRSCNKWLNTLKTVQFNGDNFRANQVMCDEKFDLAKQTGIEYHQFCYYFFRYSQSIDALIEQAYEQIESRKIEAKEAWKIVEKNFIRTLGNEIFGL